MRCVAFWPASSCAAVGLLFAVVFRMMMPLIKRRDLVGLVVLVAVFVAIGVLRAAAAGGAAGRDPAQRGRHLSMRRRVAA